MALSSRPAVPDIEIEIVKDTTIDPAQFSVSISGRTVLIKNADEDISIYDLFVILHALGMQIDYKEL